MNKKKLLIIAAANNFHFIKDIADNLSEWFSVKKVRFNSDILRIGDIHKQADEADIVWLEWADGLNIDFLIHSSLLANKKVILRLHRYELFTPRTLKLLSDLTNFGGYKNIDKLVFVSEFVRQIGISKFPWMKDVSVVVPNLFDHTKFPMAAGKKKGYNLLFLGRISYVKNLPLCLTMFNELLKLDSNYKLHIVGEISDPELKYYAVNFIAKTKMQDNVLWHGRVPHEKLPNLMADMNYIVCSSIFEAHPVGIIEGMCCGLKPVVFDFPGAENIYPAKWRWIDRSDFIHSFGGVYDSREYRDNVIDRFSIEKNIGRYKELIDEVING